MKGVKILLAFLLLIPFSLFAQNQNKGKLSGLMFGDYYYEVSNHIKNFQDRNGFWIRRIYFKYTKDLGQNFSACLLFEMNTPDGLNSNINKPVPFVKAAFLNWKFKNSQQMRLGISLTPAYGNILKLWGYRCVEKTPLDLHKFAHIVDLGVALQGSLDNAGKLSYHLMLANGSGNKSDGNSGKKIMLSLGWKPVKGLIFDIYGDWDNNPGQTDWYTLRGIIGYQTSGLRMAALFTHQVRQNPTGNDTKLNMGSVFAVNKFSPKLALFARADRCFDPDPLGNTIDYIPFDPTAKSTLFIAGLDYTLGPDVHIMPNLETVIYDKVNGTRPDSDIIPRVTFFYRF